MSKNADKEIARQRTPGRKLTQEDLSSISGGKELLLRGCCTQECCGGGRFSRIQSN